MPARNEIQKQIDRLRLSAQDIVRRDYLKKLSEKTGRETILYASAAFSTKRPGIPPGFLSIDSGDMHGFMAAVHSLKGRKLDLILHSPGGSGDAAEQIVNYLRAKFDHIRAIIPQAAMSAATMIACACDKILMGKQSAIGPVDPQFVITTPTGPMAIAAQSIIGEFEQGKAEVAADPRTAPIWVGKIKQYPPGILNACVSATKLANEKVRTWLGNYMFAGRTDGTAKAGEIADWLSTSDHHNSHGHPINITLAREKGLDVDAIEDDQELQDLILSVLHSTMITFEVTPTIKLIENQDGKMWGIQASQATP